MPTGLGQYPLLLKALRMGAFCLSGSPSPLPPDPVRGRLSPASGRGSKAKLPARCGLQTIFVPQDPSGGQLVVLHHGNTSHAAGRVANTP